MKEERESKTARFISRAKAGLSLLRNQTETLATQATNGVKILGTK